LTLFKLNNSSYSMVFGGVTNCSEGVVRCEKHF